jgi:BioD-like phosphotransacetylase family protein
MKRILVVSTEKHAGKSLLSLAMGRSFQSRGLRVGYMKPISFEVSYVTGEPLDQDAEAVRSLLSLDDDIHDIAPVPLEGPFLRETIESGDRGFRNRILQAYNNISLDRDVVVIEGRNYLGLGVSAGLSDHDLADLLSTDVLLLSRYDGEEAIDRILCALRLFEDGPAVLGVVLKDVPSDRSLTWLEEVFVPFLAERGAEVLGMVPYDPRFRSVRTDDIARRLGGRIITSRHEVHDVRYFVVGAMGVESSLRTFRRTPDLAVITGADRQEIQGAALDVMNLRCLILTGAQRPARDIVERADQRRIPIILAGQNTTMTASICAAMLDRVWIAPGPALEASIQNVRANVDFARILEKTADR